VEWCETTKYLVAYFQGGSSVIGLMLVLLKENFSLPAMQFFYIVQELMSWHCYVYKN